MSMQPHVKFIPLSTHVVIRPDPLPEKSPGGIIIPDTVRDALASKESALVGTLVSMGPGMKKKSGGRWPMPDIAIGSKVYYYSKGGHDILLDDVPHLVTRDEMILAVIED